MRALLVVALLVAGLARARADDGSAGIENFVAGLGSESDECAFLRQLCVGARASLRREAETPPNADVLASRQGGIADARVRDAVNASRAIERKRGRRLACFDDADCTGIVPPAKPR